MYRLPRPAGETPSCRSRPNLQAPPLRAAAVAQGLVPRHGAITPVSRPLPSSLAPSGPPHSALLAPASLVSTAPHESGFGFPPTTMDGLMRDDPLNDYQFADDESFDAEQYREVEALDGAMQSGYYTGLLVNGVESSQLPAHVTDPMVNDASAAAKSSQGRTKNFSNQEDILLVSAWLNISIDPIQGVNQSQGTYWERIYEYFHTNKEFESTRTVVSLVNRWSTILHDVNAFCGCLARTQMLNQSGTTIEDKITKACVLYKAEDKNHRKFTLMHCWNALKDQPKWIDRKKDMGCAQKASNKKQKTMQPAAPDGGGSDVQGSGRPEGQKMAKQKLKQGRTMDAVEYLMAKKKEGDNEKELKKDERCKKAFDLQEDRNKLEREKFEYQKQQTEKEEEERIMGLDLTTMAYKRQQYYEARQNEILARRCNM